MSAAELLDVYHCYRVNRAGKGLPMTLTFGTSTTGEIADGEVKMFSVSELSDITGIPKTRLRSRTYQNHCLRDVLSLKPISKTRNANGSRKCNPKKKCFAENSGGSRVAFEFD